MMSLFSTNRFSNLSSERTVNIKTLTENSILEAPGSEEVEDVIESSYFNDIEYDDKLIDPLSEVLSISNEDRSLYMNITEDTIKSIVQESSALLEFNLFGKTDYTQKCTNNINRASKYVRKYGKKLHTKVSTFLIKDKKKNEQYLEYISKVDGSKYPGINGFTFITRPMVKKIESISDIDKFCQFTKRAVNGIVSETNPDELIGYFEELNIAIESLNDTDLKIETEILSRSNTWRPKSQDIAVLKDYVNGRSLLNSITQCAGKVDKNIDNVLEFCNKAILSVTKNSKLDYATQMEKVKYITKCSSAFSGFVILKYCNYSDMMTRVVANYRRALNDYGQYCMKVYNGKSVNESVDDVLAGLVSELYTFESLK